MQCTECTMCENYFRFFFSLRVLSCDLLLIWEQTILNFIAHLRLFQELRQRENKMLLRSSRLIELDRVHLSVGTWTFYNICWLFSLYCAMLCSVVWFLYFHLLFFFFFLFTLPFAFAHFDFIYTANSIWVDALLSPFWNQIFIMF